MGHKINIMYLLNSKTALLQWVSLLKKNRLNNVIVFRFIVEKNCSIILYLHILHFQ